MGVEEVKERCCEGWVDKGWQGEFLDIRNNCQLRRYLTAKLASLYPDLSSKPPSLLILHTQIYIYIYIYSQYTIQGTIWRHPQSRGSKQFGNILHTTSELTYDLWPPRHFVRDSNSRVGFFVSPLLFILSILRHKLPICLVWRISSQQSAMSIVLYTIVLYFNTSYF